MLLECVSVPAVKMLLALAVWEVKSAPEPTVTAAARPIVPRPSSRVRGDDRHKAEMRFIGAPG